MLAAEHAALHIYGFQIQGLCLAVAAQRVRQSQLAQQSQAPDVEHREAELTDGLKTLSLDLKVIRADTVLMTSPASLHLLPAGPVDAGTLTRLAALDETEPLTGDVLLAADPFARTGEAVALLRLRAHQARRRSGAARRLGLGRLGLAA